MIVRSAESSPMREDNGLAFPVVLSIAFS